LTEPTRKPKRKLSAHGPEVTNEQARKTALVVAAVLFLVGAWQLYRERTTVVAVLGSIVLVLAFIAFFVPIAARGFHRFWMGIALVLGYINSRILLSLVYYGLFTPYRLVSRIVGRDPLRRRSAKEPTYWVKRANTRQTTAQFERLF
jgi:hypothetical protein